MKARKTNSASPQFQICAALHAHGDMDLAQLRKKVKVGNDQALSNGIYAAKLAGRIEKLEGGSFRLTDAGKEWASGGANLQLQRTRSTPAKVVTGKRTRKAKDLDKDERRRIGVVAVRNGMPVPDEDAVRPNSFRCAVYSDGGFFLAKGDQRIELDAGEHAWMLRYLERMTELEETT